MSDLGSNLFEQAHKVVLYDADDMEAIGHDTGTGKEAPDEPSVRTEQVDADYFDLLPALELTEVASQVLATTAFYQIEDTTVLQVAQRRYHLVATVQTMLVDSSTCGQVILNRSLALRRVNCS